MEHTVFDRTRTGLRKVKGTFWGFTQICSWLSCFCKWNWTFIIQPPISDFYFTTQIVNNCILHMLQDCEGFFWIILQALTHGNHLTVIYRHWFIQWILEPLEFDIFSTLSPDVVIFDNSNLSPLTMTCPWMESTHMLKENPFNNGCFMNVFLKRAKWNCNNISNALVAVHRIWSLSSSPDGRPWSKSGPLGYESRPLENEIIKNKLLSGLLLYFIISDDPDWFPLIQKPDSRMNAIWDVCILVARWESVITLDSYHTRAHTVQTHRQTDKVTSLRHQIPP